MPYGKTIKDTGYKNQLRTEGEQKDTKLKQKLRPSWNACAKKYLEICRGRWMLAKQYVVVNSTTNCNYYILKINSTFKMKF